MERLPLKRSPDLDLAVANRAAQFNRWLELALEGGQSESSAVPVAAEGESREVGLAKVAGQGDGGFRIGSGGLKGGSALEIGIEILKWGYPCC